MRALLALLLSCLLAAPARAALRRPARIAPIPGQLELELRLHPDAAKVAEAAPSLLTAETAGLPASVLEMPPAVARAVADGDPRGVFRAARRADWLPSETSGPPHDLYQLGESLHEADRLALERTLEHVFDRSLPRPPLVVAGRKPSPPPKPSKPPKPRRRSIFDFKLFGELLRKNPVLAEHPLKHIETKRRILEACGYWRLVGPGNSRIPIRQAEEARVARVFADVLRRYRRGLINEP